MCTYQGTGVGGVVVVIALLIVVVVVVVNALVPMGVVTLSMNDCSDVRTNGLDVVAVVPMGNKRDASEITIKIHTYNTTLA